jgi:hypothetical protein
MPRSLTAPELSANPFTFLSVGSFPATNVEALAKEDQYGTDSMDVDRASRSPSPESDRDLVQERESLWSRDARIAFVISTPEVLPKSERFADLLLFASGSMIW